MTLTVQTPYELRQDAPGKWRVHSLHGGISYEGTMRECNLWIMLNGNSSGWYNWEFDANRHRNPAEYAL